MNWLDRLHERMQTEDVLQMSIDGQIWTIERQNGVLHFSNGLGREESFASIDSLETAIQSWFENPSIVIVS